MYTFIWIEKKRNSKSSDLWKSLSKKQNNVSTGMGNTVSSFNYIFNPLTFKVEKLDLKIWILIFIFYKRSGPAG